MHLPAFTELGAVVGSLTLVVSNIFKSSSMLLRDFAVSRGIVLGLELLSCAVHLRAMIGLSIGFLSDVNISPSCTSTPTALACSTPPLVGDGVTLLFGFMAMKLCPPTEYFIPGGGRLEPLVFFHFLAIVGMMS